MRNDHDDHDLHLLRRAVSQQSGRCANLCGCVLSVRTARLFDDGSGALLAMCPECDDWSGHFDLIGEAADMLTCVLLPAVDALADQ